MTHKVLMRAGLITMFCAMVMQLIAMITSEDFVARMALSQFVFGCLFLGAAFFLRRTGL